MWRIVLIFMRNAWRKRSRQWKKLENLLKQINKHLKKKNHVFSYFIFNI